MIHREIQSKIEAKMHKGKAIVIVGPRQTGKTTLLKQILPIGKEGVIWLSGDTTNDREILKPSSSAALRSLVGNSKYLVIDEAQRMEEIGLSIKIIVDNIPSVQVIATGSSAIDISSKINEPLTGRKFEFSLYPFSFGELATHTNTFTELSQLENRLIYGSYPEIVTNPGEEKERLSLLSDSYLYKDLLTYDRIKKPALLTQLLKAVALQIGSEVSYNELAQLCGVDKETVERYIDLLEKTFIIFKLGSYSRNVRNELKKSKKIYFYDLGIRNAIIGNFAPLSIRQDSGALFENYIISEKIKQNAYRGILRHPWFWRTTQQQEIDYIEEYDGQLDAYEIKWSPKRGKKISSTFSKNYPLRKAQFLNKENYFDWLL